MADEKHRLIHDAEAALQLGNMAAAIAGFREVLSIDPAMADVWYNLGYALRLDRQFAASIDAYGQALANGVTQPEEVHLNRAAILSEHLDAADKAREELNEALRLNRGFLHGWLNLGLLYEDMGQPLAARNAYERVLEIEPQNGRAMERLAMIATFNGEAAVILPRLEAALRLPTLLTEDATDVAFGLANLYDAAGEHDRAFSLAAAANRAQHRQLPSNLRYDPIAHERLIDELCEMRFPVPSLPADIDGAVPIFICGLFRSGSTLAEQLLARHSETVAGGEYDFIPEIVRTRLQPYPKALAKTGRDVPESLRRDYLSRLAATGYKGGPVSDKRCDNFLHIGLIKSLFPAAKIIHTVRSPLDNAVSLFFQHFADGIDYSTDLDHLGHWLAQYRRMMRHWRTLYGPDILDFDYDSVVRDAEPAVGAMVEHCGLEWKSDMGAGKAVVRTASAWQVRQPLHRRSSGRWHNYARHLESLRRAAGIDDQGNWLP
jgi:tetratricopeptide (TPR) repeat protein